MYRNGVFGPEPADETHQRQENQKEGKEEEPTEEALPPADSRPIGGVRNFPVGLIAPFIQASSIEGGEGGGGGEASDGDDTWALYAKRFTRSELAYMNQYMRQQKEEEIQNEAAPTLSVTPAAVSNISVSAVLNFVQEMCDAAENERRDHDDSFRSGAGAPENERNPYETFFRSMVRDMDRSIQRLSRGRIMVARKDKYRCALSQIGLASKVDLLKSGPGGTGGARSSLSRGTFDLTKDESVGGVSADDPSDMSQKPGAKRYALIKYLATVAIPSRIVDQHGNPVSLETGQLMFITEMLHSCAALAHGKDWNACKLSFLRKHKLEEIKYQLICSSPRRFGKTWSVCIFVLALMLSIPRITIAVFATNKRTSESIISWTLKFLMAMPNGEDRLGRRASDRITILPQEVIDSGVRLNAWERRNHELASTLIALPADADGWLPPPPSLSLSLSPPPLPRPSLSRAPGNIRLMCNFPPFLFTQHPERASERASV